MRRSALALLACGLASLTPGSAAAGDFDDFALYVGAGPSYASSLFQDDVEDAIGVDTDIEDSWGANVRAGVRLLSFLAVEAQYEWISDYDIEVAGVHAASLETHVLTGNVKLLVPLWRLQPYLLAGIGFERFEVDDELGLGIDEEEDALAGRLGGGIDLYLTKHIVLNLEGSVVVSDQEISLPNGDDIEGIHYFAGGAGLQFHF